MEENAAASRTERERERESAKEEREEKLSGTGNRVESEWAWRLFGLEMVFHTELQCRCSS
jgi:hypothetical protein